MTRLTFGVSALSFAVNMTVNTNAVQNQHSHPQAALAVLKSFYVDDRLTSANSVSEAIVLQKELQQLFDKGRLLLLYATLDEDGLLRVGGRTHQSMEFYDKQHPFIMPGKHRVTKMLIQHEHAYLLHARPTLVVASLAPRFAIVGTRRAVRDVTHSCVVCRCVAGKPRLQLLC